MTDKTLILKKLKELEGCVHALENLRNCDISDVKGSKEKEWAIERGLQLSIQIVVDTGAHILASVGDENIEDYADVIERLGDKNILPKDFAARIKSMVGFRNILVHEYAKVDLDIVYDMLKNRLGDFREFAAHINKFMG